MIKFMVLLFSLSFSGTLLLLLILILKPLYKNHFSKRWQYYILLVVALRFLLPFAPGVTLTGFKFETAGHTVSTARFIVPNLYDTDDADFTPPQLPLEFQLNPVAEPAGISSDLLFIYIFFAWFSISLALMIRKITIYQNFLKYIEVGSSEISEIPILNTLSDCEEKLNIKNTMDLYCNPLTASPMLVGFLRPRIVLPNLQMSAEEMTCIFKHELTHYRQKDILYKWLIQIAICIHWFNPFIYLLGHEMNKACELSCDEIVISTMDESAKKVYGDTLIASAKTMGGYKRSLVSITLTESAQQLKERLESIMIFKRKSKLIAIITVCFTAVVCFCFIAMGAYVAPVSDSNDVKHYEKTIVQVGDTVEYTYIHTGYYYNSFIFEMGWNLPEDAIQEYPVHKTITLPDMSQVTVYFDEDARKYVNHQEAIDALGQLIFSLNSTDSQTSQLPIVNPCISNITPATPSQLTELAKEFYEKRSLVKFSAIFSALDADMQTTYLQKMYQDDNISFFSSIVQHLDLDTILLYADKSEQDNKITFFSVLLDDLPSGHLNSYAEKYYAEGNITKFSIVVPYLSEQDSRKWLDRAEKDGKTTFYAVISNELFE